MAIVTMKKLRLMAVRSARDELLRELLRHGCVEVSEPAELQDEAFASLLHREDGELMAARGHQQTLQQALDILNRYAPAKSSLLSPKPEVEGELPFSDGPEGKYYTSAVIWAETSCPWVTGYPVP